MKISELLTTAPEHFETPLQEKVYAFLAEHSIAFERVENDPARTMEECKLIAEKLGCPIAKTLFLTNRQQTKFYLYLMPDDKPFVTKDFSKNLGISRVSFASAELLREKMGVEPGAATVLCLLLESAKDVQLVIDKQIAESDYFGCTDGTSTCYMKIKTEEISANFDYVRLD